MLKPSSLKNVTKTILGVRSLTGKFVGGDGVKPAAWFSSISLDIVVKASKISKYMVSKSCDSFEYGSLNGGHFITRENMRMGGWEQSSFTDCIYIRMCFYNIQYDEQNSAFKLKTGSAYSRKIKWWTGAQGFRFNYDVKISKLTHK